MFVSFSNLVIFYSSLRRWSGGVQTLQDPCSRSYFQVKLGINGLLISVQFSSGQLSCSAVSNSLWPHESQDARPPCPSPSPGVHSNSRPLSKGRHPAISFSVVPFSSCLQSLPASEPFPMSQLFVWGGQSIGVSALASFLRKDIQGWSPSKWTG